MFGVPLKKLHHTYIIEGTDHRIADVLGYLEKEGINTIGNPAVISLIHTRFGIDEARSLKLESQTRTHERGTFFIITAGVITREAEQSLLKLFEEPIAGLHFFLITPFPENLLDTLRSRALLIRRPMPEINSESFLKKSITERLQTIKDILKKSEDEEEGSTEARLSALRILDSIESELRSKIIQGKDYTVLRQLETLLTLKEYLHGQSSSVKMILEYLALALSEQ